MNGASQSGPARPLRPKASPLRSPHLSSPLLKAPKGGGLASCMTTAVGALILAGLTYFNDSEVSRMATAVAQGHCFSPDVPEDRIDDRLLPADLDRACKSIQHPDYNSFVGLVGPKGTGKSILLDRLGYKLISEGKSSVVKLKQPTVGPLLDDVYHLLKSQVATLPGLWGWPRLRPLSPEATVLEVLQRVRERTGKPVTLLVDLYPTKPMGPTEIEYFVREVKFYATDVKVMHCGFAAAEATLEFQEQAHREPRLKLYHAQELTIEKAKMLLEKCKGQEVKEEHLKRFIRSFITLGVYGDLLDRGEYVESSFKQLREEIRCLPEPYRNLIREAAKEPIGYREIYSKDLTHQHVRQLLVENNLLTLNEHHLYQLHHEAVGEAIQEL